MARTAACSTALPPPERWPTEVRGLFCDLDPDTIAPRGHRPFVIQRVLSSGGIGPFRWIRSLASDEELRRHIKGREGREIAPRRLRYFELVLGLPRAEVSAWIRRQGRSPAPGRRRELSFLEFRYPELEPPIPWAACKCSLASLADLSSMKLAALAQRGARKDFMDIYALAREFRPLPELVGLYQRKSAVKDPGHLLFALAFFDDAEKEPMPDMLWAVTWGEVKKSIRKALKDMS
jgi:hypothetical protein